MVKKKSKPDNALTKGQKLTGKIWEDFCVLDYTHTHLSNDEIAFLIFVNFTGSKFYLSKMT